MNTVSAVWWKSDLIKYFNQHNLRKEDSISKTYTIKCLRCNMISFKENWREFRNILSSFCYRKRCNPNSRIFPLYWWEDGTPIGHSKQLPNN